MNKNKIIFALILASNISFAQTNSQSALDAYNAQMAELAARKQQLSDMPTTGQQKSFGGVCDSTCLTAPNITPIAAQPDSVYINPYIIPTPPPVNGVCGSANGSSSTTAPASGLCSTGNPSPVITAGLSYTWICAGQFGGTSTGCSANKVNLRWEMVSCGGWDTSLATVTHSNCLGPATESEWNWRYPSSIWVRVAAPTTGPYYGFSWSVQPKPSFDCSESMVGKKYAVFSGGINNTGGDSPDYSVITGYTCKSY